jgi:hypothetical protein
VRLAFVPLPIQDGATWKCALRSVAYALARLHHAVGGGFGPLATDIAVVATRGGSTGTLRRASTPAGAASAPGGPT